ncbi:exported protein of unknown function [Candidatus Promineifilum breve]|uniref:Solute-binding protein family 5 domain-containing protein n=1 Tax=Candidatus Promineifilum breve TaxID=1806508 RepID=A0A160T0E2_9CHLR|nr:ABC transporter substrate-binding protein [Candidatus Promineifilum breve]CUS02168.2 exported protein of unknown function [Candidatus Promineifilum breve]
MKKNRVLLLLGLLLLAALAITACTATSGDVQQAIEEVAPTLAAAATELAPTVQAAVEEVAPTVAAAATELAGGEATAEATAEPVAEEPAGDLMVVGTECDTEGYTGLFKEIAAIDPLTVQFTMCAPDPAFPSKAAFTSFAIHPSENLEATGATGDLLEAPIGTGPYMVEEWSRGEELTFTKNANYWASRPSPRRSSSVGRPSRPRDCWSCNPARLTVSTTPPRMTSSRSPPTPTCNCWSARPSTSSTWA